MTYPLGARVRVNFEATGKVIGRTYGHGQRIEIRTDDGEIVEVPVEHVYPTGEVVHLPVRDTGTAA